MAKSTHDLPIIQLQQGKWAELPVSLFSRSTDGSLTDYPTYVQLMADEAGLHVDFKCESNQFVHENYMTQHNEPLYNQEVFELFIAAGEADPAHYLEFEINPNNAVWIGHIANPGLGEGAIDGKMVAYESSGILHQAMKGDKEWSGRFSIPWALIPGGKQANYRVNFYRIVSTKSHLNLDWACSEADCEFLCWNSTLSGKAPAFHRPKRFGHLQIQ
ncbi:MAG: carbohydrate-binding family 9-like protein [Saprospiraceae bacterium]|nr:carbohydrate-binding family 9-like protein [Saprospiraceae bacterium]